MKNFLWVIIIVAVLVFLYILINLSASRIGFNFSLNKIDFSTLSLNDFKSDIAHVKVNVNTIVTNLNPFNINFSFLEVWIYHNGILIAKSSEVLKGKINIKSNSVTSFVTPLDLYVNPESIRVATLIKLKRPVKIDYQVSLKLFGIPLPKYKNSYIANV